MSERINSINSIILKHKYELNLNSENRILYNSDLDKSDSNQNNKEDDKNIIRIYNLKKIEDNNKNEIDKISINSDYKDEYEFQYKLIEELKNNEFIFIKDFPEETTNEKNIKYINWLYMIYNKNKESNNNKNNLNKLKINNKNEKEDYTELIKKLKNKLFFCINPKCKSITYISDNLKNKFEELQNLKDFNYINEELNGQKKIRCPICLKYKCIYCNKLSTLKMSYCCPLQAFTTCYNSKIRRHNCLYSLCLYTPIIRVWFFGFTLSFPLYRSLTKPGKLLLNKEKMINKNREEFGLYWTKSEYEEFDIMNFFHITGSIIWTIVYAIIIEEFLIFFMLICFIFRKNYFRQFLNCFYLLCFYPF
jgi:hypothetical protein